MWPELQSAVKAAISDNPAELKGEAVALRMGVSTGRLYGWGDSAQDEIIPLNRLVQLTHITGDIRPVSALAYICGGVFIPTSLLMGPDDRQALAKMVQEFGELLKTHAAAIADGKITVREMKDLERESAGLQQAIATFMVSLREGKAL